MTDNPYPVGTTVFAKLKGYPWWPARIESDDDLPPNVSSKKPKQRPIWPVFFFGSYDYGWFGTTELKSFDPASAEKAKAALKKGNALRTALSEALDPSLVQVSADVEPDEFEDDHEQEQVAPVKKKALTKAKKVTQKKETAAEKKRRPSSSEDQPVKRKVAKKASVIEEDEDGSPEPKGLSRSRLESDFRSVDDDISIGDASNGRTKRSEDDGGDSADLRAKKRLRSGGPSERLLKLRHKLQKLLLVEGLTDEVLVQNLEKADPILAEVEAFDIDLQMLKDTKIGRLMKKISALQFSRDDHNVVERSIKLIKQYKTMMEKAQENGGGEAVVASPVKSEVTAVPTKTLVVTGANADQTSTNASLANSNKNGVDPFAPAPEAVVAAVAAIVETDTVPEVSSSLPIQSQDNVELTKAENTTVQATPGH
ncbi:hypothetical protein BGZ49_007680 [Haplosporangium sp. Z 27]|nr:hypothetical protein BGZ49_007680 [Haplosporangium sp. Z 27]